MASYYLESLGPQKRNIDLLKDQVLIIGRSQDCFISCKSTMVSRKHCELRFQGNYWTAKDLGSMNYVFINGKRIPEGAVKRIVHGDRLGIGTPSVKPEDESHVVFLVCDKNYGSVEDDDCVIIENGENAPGGLRRQPTVKVEREASPTPSYSTTKPHNSCETAVQKPLEETMPNLHPKPIPEQCQKLLLIPKQEADSSPVLVSSTSDFLQDPSSPAAVSVVPLLSLPSPSHVVKTAEAIPLNPFVFSSPSHESDRTRSCTSPEVKVNLGSVKRSLSPPPVPVIGNTSVIAAEMAPTHAVEMSPIRLPALDIKPEPMEEDEEDNFSYSQYDDVLILYEDINALPVKDIKAEPDPEPFHNSDDNESEQDDNFIFPKPKITQAQDAQEVSLSSPIPNPVESASEVSRASPLPSTSTDRAILSPRLSAAELEQDDWFPELSQAFYDEDKETAHTSTSKRVIKSEADKDSPPKKRFKVSPPKAKFCEPKPVRVRGASALTSSSFYGKKATSSPKKGKSTSRSTTMNKGKKGDSVKDRLKKQYGLEGYSNSVKALKTPELAILGQKAVKGRSSNAASNPATKNSDSVANPVAVAAAPTAPPPEAAPKSKKPASVKAKVTTSNRSSIFLCQPQNGLGAKGKKVVPQPVPKDQPPRRPSDDHLGVLPEQLQIPKRVSFADLQVNPAVTKRLARLPSVSPPSTDASHKHKNPVVRSSSVTENVDCGVDSVLMRIFHWNVRWLEEQKKTTEPPPVASTRKKVTLSVMSKYASFEAYLATFQPLMLYELWARISRDWEEMRLRHSDLMVVISDVKPEGGTEAHPNFLIVKCYGVVPENKDKLNQYPSPGQLIVLDLVIDPRSPQTGTGDRRENSTSTKRAAIFGTVDNMTRRPYNSGVTLPPIVTEVCKGKIPACFVNLDIRIRYKPYVVQFDAGHRVRVVSYVKSELRQFRAISSLNHSPLLDVITTLKPAYFATSTKPKYSLLPALRNGLNRSQGHAVNSIADIILKDPSSPNVSLIQGPPGTGKTHTIVSLILQTLYSASHYESWASKHPKTLAPRILLCAPSNAAVDEIVLRLKEERIRVPQEKRFRLVRIGIKEHMSPEVRDVSLDCLAQRLAHSARDVATRDNLRLEVQGLEDKLKIQRSQLNLCVNDNDARLKQRKIDLLAEHLASAQNDLKEFTSADNASSDWRRKEQVNRKKILAGADVIATTLNSCTVSIMEQVFLKGGVGTNRPFTCCIIDEASQCTEPESILPLVFGMKKLVLIGDPEQLPATVLSSMAMEKSFGQSLFTRLFTHLRDLEQNLPAILLDTQYRMHPEVAKWPSFYFYGNRLVTSPTVVRKCALVPYAFLNVVDSQEHWFHTEVGNVVEAQMAAALAARIVLNPETQSLTVGVITPYRKQRRLVEQALHKYPKSVLETVEINTVDGFQGREKDVIIFSCVRARGANQSVGFLANEQRLNVALTRARYVLYVLGHKETLAGTSGWTELIRDAEERRVISDVSSSMPIEQLMTKLSLKST